MRKRFLLYLTIALVLMHSVTAVFAANYEKTNAQTAMKVLSAVGVLDEKLQSDTDYAKKTITRGEFVSMVFSAKYNKTMASYGAPVFIDVTRETAYAAEINTAFSLGIISGDGGNMFRPDEPITMNELVKILVNLAGYSVKANEKSGYPDGYYAVAVELGITDGITVGGTDTVTVSDASLMVYRTINTPRMEVDSSGTYSVGDATLMEDSLHIYSRRGVVTAFNNMSLADGDNPKEGTIKIDGIEYELPDTNFKTYVGHTVDFWYSVDSDDVCVIKYIEEADGNTASLFIDREELEINDSGFSAKQIVYSNEDGKRKIIKIDTERVLVNGLSKLTEKSDFDFTGYDGGYVNAVRNTKGEYDFIEIVKYNNKIVLSIDKDNEIIYFKDGSKLMLNPNDYENPNVLVNVTDKYYNSKNINDFHINSVVSIYESSTGNYVGAFISDDVLSGSAEAVDYGKGKIKIGGTWYKTAGDIVCSPGNNYSFYMDFRYYIADADLAAQGDTFAYLINLSYEQGTEQAFVRVFNPAGNKVEVLQLNDKFKAGTSSGKSSFKAAESDIIRLKSLLSATADASGNGISQLVQIKKNSDGKVSLITYAGKSENDFSLDYSASSIYSSSTGYIDGRFSTDSADTVIIRVPSNRTQYDKYSTASMPNRCYCTEAYLYDIDKDNNVPAVIVVNTDAVTYTNDTIIWSSLGVVADKSETFTGDKVQTAVNIYIGGALRTFFYDEDESIKDPNGNDIKIDSLVKGDVFQIVLDNNEIAVAKPVYQSPLRTDFGFVNTSPGTIHSNYVNYGKIRAIITDNIIVSNDTNNVEVKADIKNVNVYRFNAQSKTVEKVSTSVLAYNQDVVYRKVDGKFSDIIIYE